jgi:hypothetical protein
MCLYQTAFRINRDAYTVSNWARDADDSGSGSAGHGIVLHGRAPKSSVLRLYSNAQAMAFAFLSA